jgi:hypothetical protein
LFDEWARRIAAQLYSKGVSLAGVPRLRKNQAGFAPRPASEIAVLLRHDPENGSRVSEKIMLKQKARAGCRFNDSTQSHPALKAAYRKDPTVLQSRLGAIAQALNSGDFVKAMITAVHTRTPELSPQAALRLAEADPGLTKHNYNPNEPRDWHGRWTRDERYMRCYRDRQKNFMRRCGYKTKRDA